MIHLFRFFISKALYHGNIIHVLYAHVKQVYFPFYKQLLYDYLHKLHYSSISHLPNIPHGNTKPFSLIGSPISPYFIFPPYFLETVSFSIFYNTVLDIPVVYEFIKKNNGFSLNIFMHAFIRLYRLCSNFHISPLGPLP